MSTKENNEVKKMELIEKSNEHQTFYNNGNFLPCG